MKKYFKTDESVCGLDKFKLVLKNDTHSAYIKLDGKTMQLSINTTMYIGKGNITFEIEGISIGGSSGLKEFVLFVHNTNDRPVFGSKGGTLDGRLINCNSPGVRRCGNTGKNGKKGATHD